MFFYHQLLGRTVDLRHLISQRMNDMIIQSLKAAITRFEASDITCIVVCKLHASVYVHTHAHTYAHSSAHIHTQYLIKGSRESSLFVNTVA